METEQVTLEKLYLYLVSFRRDTEQRLANIEYHLALHDKQFEQINDRFEQINDRFKQVNERFEQMNDRFNQIEKRIEGLEEKVQAVYETRDKVSMQFSRRVLLGNSVLAGIVAFFVALITGRYTP